MSVYKPKTSRYWQYDFQHRGRRFHGSTAQETRRAAEEVERRRRRAAALGELDVDDIPTLHQAATSWWQDHAQHLATADDLWTRIGVCERLLGKATKVTDLDETAIAGAIRRRRRETYVKSKAKGATRYPIQPATVNQDIPLTLRRILKHVAKGQLKTLMPAIDWAGLMLAEPEPALRIYTAAQQAAWRAACDPTAAVALDLLLTYGMRFGELFFAPAAYHPADPADAESFPFLLLENRKKQLMILPLRSDDARRIAARAGRAQAAGLPSIWLEVAPGRKLIAISYDALLSRLRAAARRAGLTMPRMVHGARHHAGSTILRQTRNFKAAQQLLGHKDMKSTMRYAHVLAHDLHAALEGQSRNTPEADAADGEFSPPKQRRRRRAPGHS